MRTPTSPEALTAEWLTCALHKTGTIQHARITSVDAQTLGEGKGFIGQLARLRLEYDVREEGAPQSIIAKLSGIRSKPEVYFYEQVAPLVELRTPHCYYSHIDPAAEKCLLLLEDLAPARNGTRSAGCSLEDAELAIREIAKFHATWWENTQLAELDWLPDLADQPEILTIQDMWPQMWDCFLETVERPLPREILDIGKRCGRNLGYLVNQLFQEPPRTLIHWDYQLDNLFFGLSQDDAPLTVIDWQLATRGRGVTDIAYFLGENVSVQDRRAKEMDLLRIYHEILAENNVRGYSFDQCLDDYRLSMLFRLGAIVYTVTQSGFTDEQKRLHVDTLLPRNNAAILDLDAGELLPK